MLFNIKQNKRKTQVVRSLGVGKVYPFSFTFDKDGSTSKLDIIVQDSQGNITGDNIVMAKMVIKFLFKESRKVKLPFVQSGKMSILDSKGLLAEKAVSGLLNTIQFNLSPNKDLIQKFINPDDARNEDLIFSYEFRCYDVWEKKSVDFSAQEPIFFKIKQVLDKATQYYFIGNEETRLLRFTPKIFLDNKKSNAYEQIILYQDLTSPKKDRFNLASNISNSLVSSSLVRPNFNRPIFSILPYFDTSLLTMLPKVDSTNDNYWVDYVQKDLYWVKPDLELLLPNNGMSFESAPFQFTIKNIGILADGSPALEADLVVTLRQFLNKAWVASLGEKTKTRLLNILNPLYRIQLPYMDAAGNQKQTYLEASTVERDKDHVKLKFSVSNEWVRLLYGALSTPSLPPASRPTLILSYYFNAMQRKRDNVSYLVSGLQLGNSVQLANLNKLNNSNKRFASPKDSSSKKAIRSLPKPSLAMANNNAVLTAHIPSLVAVSNINWNTAAIDRLKKKEYVRQSINISHKLDLTVQCNSYGDYFAELKNDSKIAIGCSEPMRLGIIKTPLYRKIIELDHAKYEVYKSQVMPQMFVVVPKSYVIARSLEAPEKFAPELFLHGVVDIENLADSRCVVDLKLQPNITYYERIELERGLSNFTAYPAQITYITELVGEESINWNLSNSVIEKANTFTFEHSIHATLETNIMDAQLCKSMLERGGITGIYKKKLDAEEEFSTQMVVTLDSIAQPWSGEGIRIEHFTGALHITNELESIVHVDRLAKIEQGGEGEIPVQQNVAPGETFILGHDLAHKDYIPIFSIQTDQQALSENYAYIEDLFQQIICFDLFSSPENGDLLEVNVGIQDQPPYTKLDFTDGSKEKESVLLIPISEIVSSVLFGYFIKYRAPNGTTYESGWIHHNFSTTGNIINITSNKIT